MKLIHHGGYNDAERDSYKEIIFSNTVQSMRAILEALPQLDLQLAPHNDARRATILALPAQIEADVLPRDVADAVRALWRDPAVVDAVRRAREFQLNDSAVYYFAAIDRMASPAYLPSDQDILRSRVKTTGITETTFRVGELTYKLFDVGGQRSERKKWIHCFENVTALVFLVSLSEYDQMLYEDESVNRMQEALTLFDSICNSRWFVKTSIILFLNKIDLFAEKLPRSPLEDYFPDYQGGANYDAACDYLLHRFVSLNQSAATKQIYAHYTCATDTQQIKCTSPFFTGCVCVHRTEVRRGCGGRPVRLWRCLATSAVARRRLFPGGKKVRSRTCARLLDPSGLGGLAGALVECGRPAKCSPPACLFTASNRGA